MPVRAAPIVGTSTAMSLQTLSTIHERLLVTQSERLSRSATSWTIIFECANKRGYNKTQCDISIIDTDLDQAP